jgi:DNA-binding Lrp family transcriptional regulator
LPTALLLINIEVGKETKVMRLLKTIKGVEEVHLVFGAYDMVAKIKTDSMDELQEIVTNRLLRSKIIRSSTTMIIIPEKPKVVVLTEEIPKIFA